MKQILGLDNRKILNAQRFVVHGNELADRHDIVNFMHSMIILHLLALHWQALYQAIPIHYLT